MAEREGRSTAAKQESRGQLKIFLGAAPGVGKTYEMLLVAQARRREGVDVVVGVVAGARRRRASDLLDGRQQPVAAAPTHEGPHLFRLDRGAWVAADDVVRVAR